MRSFPLLIFALLFSLPAVAQLDAKLNVGSALTLDLGIAGEFALSPSSGVSIGLGHATTTAKDDGGNEYAYRRLRFVPEYRYYVSPDYGIDRFFVGAYGKLVDIKATREDETFNASRGVLGVMAGYKWLLSNNMIIELNAGGGAGTSFGTSLNNAVATRAFSWLGKIDVRLGILVGYRFGGY